MTITAKHAILFTVLDYSESWCYMHKRYNNQKVLRFINIPKDKFHPYTLWNKDALSSALHDLSPTAFKVYVYIGMHKEMSLENKKLILSKTHTMDSVNISESTYFNAIKELHQKGYIVSDPMSAHKDDYVFSEKGNVVL